jgi:hypothetical protein
MDMAGLGDSDVDALAVKETGSETGRVLEREHKKDEHEHEHEHEHVEGGRKKGVLRKLHLHHKS